MPESYLEYALDICSDFIISKFCLLYKTKIELLNAARKGFNGEKYILGQGLLILGLRDLFSDDGYFIYNKLNNDSKKLYLRCKKSIDNMLEINFRQVDISKEEMFGVLVDVNWLLVSNYIHLKEKQTGKVALREDIASIRIETKNALMEVLYDSALYYKGSVK